jgi:hypothetical protein
MNFWSKLILGFTIISLLIVLLYKPLIVNQFGFNFSKFKEACKQEQVENKIEEIPYSDEDIIPEVKLIGDDSTIVLNTIDLFVKDYYMTVDSILSVGISLNENSYNIYLATLTDFNNYTRNMCKKLGVSYKYDSIFNYYKNVVDSLYEYQNIMNDDVTSYYIITGVFREENNAVNYIADLENENAGMFYDNNLYFVYICGFYSLDEAKVYMNELIKDENFSNSWIYKNHR